MKPGRELDKLIAERVMGLDVSNPSSPMSCDVCHKDYYFEDSIKPYSTDIAAAWEVVEKLIQQEIYFEFRSDYAYSVSGYDGHNAMRMSNCDASGESFPHAICLAALKAIAPE